MALAWATLALLGLLATVAPEQAAAQTATTFISNTGQTSNNVATSVRATAFTTGTGTYTLSSVGIYLVHEPTGTITPVVAIYGDTSGNPGTLLATMTNPGTFLGVEAVSIFTAPANTTLSASTTYWLVTSNSAATDGTGFEVGAIGTTNLDSGTAAGWSLGNARFKSDIANTSWSTSSARHRFEIRGTGGTTANTAPTVANAIPDQSAPVGTAFSYAFPANTFSDADSDTLTYTATKADDTALPTWLSFTDSTRTFSGTPQAADIATVSVKVTASDGNGGSVSDEFDITVSAAADTTPPTLTSATVTSTGQIIEVLFSENLGRSNLPRASDFTVTAGGSAVTVTLVASTATLNELWVLVTPAIRQGQAVVVTYTDPTAGDDVRAIQDVAGNDAATFTTGTNSVPAVTNNSTINTPATGAPTITGTPQVGQTLTAVTTAIMDENGLTNVSYTYQWIRVDGSDSDISGATASTYTLVTADQGKTIKVKVSFTDDASRPETLTSVATAVVSAAAPSLTSAVVNETGLLIQLQFSENLQSANLPPASAFTVTVGGTAVTVSAVAAGTTPDVLQITVSPPIVQGQAVVVTYDDPTAGDDANAIQDTAGLDTPDFTTGMNGVPAVTNNSTAVDVPANWSLKPTGLAAGAKFRLLFLSSTKHGALSTDIADYNTFVQTRAAAGHTDIQSYSTGFRAVGCTAAVDARDNTSTTYTTTDKGVPIYWLNGTKAADDYEDFYDGSWDDEANDKNESGTDGPDTSQTPNYPRTGCTHDGTESFAGATSRALGTSRVRLARPNSSSSGHGPLSSELYSTVITSTFPMYGLSAVFQVAASTVVINTPPAFSASTAARSVAENTAAGQNVGAVLTATDADSDTLTYTLEGTDAASFDILSTSGQIQTKTGVTYNHEAKSTYTVIVKADDSNGGTDTVTVTITVTDVDEPPGRPAAPSVTATAGSTTSLDVTWTAPTNTGPAITSYDLQYREGASGSFTDGPQNVTGTSAAIASLTASTSHQVQVRATNAEGDGDWSLAGTGRTGNNPPVFSSSTADRSVAENSAAGQNVGAVLTATDADSDTLTYTLEGADAASFDILSASGQIQTKTGVTYNHEAQSTYTVIVKADDSNGGTDTVTVTITVTDVDEPPGRPAAPSVTATAGSTTSLDVTWTAPTNTGPAITSYDLQYREGTSGSFTDGPQNVTGTSAAIASLTASTSHQVQVRATNAEGDGDWSFSGTGQTGTSVPGAPTVLQAAASGTTRINLSWTAPASDGGSPITGYKIEVSPDGGSNWTDLEANTNSTTTTYPHTGLAAGATRHYRVSAINTNGAGLPSNVDNATTGSTVPGAPTVLQATASGNTRINLSWTAPASTGGSPITGYKIEVSSDGGSNWTDLEANTNSTTTTYAHTGLAAGDTRHYRVSAINTNGAGTPSNVANATTGSTVPGAPTVLSAAASGTTRIDLTWSAPGSDGGSPITGYKIESSPDGGSSWSDLVPNTNSTTTTYAHTGLLGGTTRHYRVSAINANGTGTPSNVANATTAASVPGAPRSLSARESGTARINLSWSAPASNGGSAITGYKIEVSSDGGSNWTDLVANTVTISTTYSHTGLPGGATRHYRVSAINTHGAGATSDVASASTGQRTVRFEADLYTATEGGSAATVAVVLSAAAAQTVTIPLTTERLSGATAEDYSGVPEGVRFAAGQARQTFTVTVTDDRDEDGLKRLRLRFGTLPSGYVPGSPRTAIVRLVDNDAGGLLLNFGTERHTTVKVREHADVRHRFSLSLRTSRYGPPTNNLQQPLTIPLVVTHQGGATAEDYTPGIPADVTFAVGQSKASFSMRAIPDGKREPGEGLRIDFGELPPGVTRGDWGPYETVEFVDEVLPKLTARFGAAEYTATEGGGAAGVAIHLNEPVDIEPVEVRLQVEPGGGATEADYSGIPASVRFAVGERTKTIRVTATNDTDDDDGESVTLSLVYDPNNRVITGNGPNSATVALEDNDGAERVTVSFGAGTYTATEGGSGATVRVELDAAPGRSLTVPLTKAHLGGATAADYSGIPGGVAFTANQTARTFTVTATDDQIGDGGESVSIGFGTLPEGVFAGSPAAAAVTLADGSEQRFEVSFNSANVQVREGARRLRLSVQLGNRYQPASGNPQRPVTIPLVVTPVGGATAADYTAIPKSVTFAEGQGSAPYYVQALPDEEDETGEGLRLDFGELPPGVTKGDYRPSQTIDFVDAGAAAANLSVAGRLLTLGYPGALDGGSTPSGGDFVVLAEAPRGQQAMVAVTAVSVRGSDVFLELDRPVAPDETVTLSYLAAAMHPIRDAAGLPAPPLADEPVRNDTGADDPLAEAALPAPLAALSEEALGAADAERLDLSSRNLTDLSALAGLSGLRELDLRDNAIADLSPLAGLTGLQLLYLSGNRIEELWPLAGLTDLRELDLRDNAIADLSPLAGLSGLQVLDLAGNRIEELWPLAGLTALERLNLSDNRIADLWPLAGLSGLQVLLLDRNRVADLSALSPLAELANLGLSGNRIADIGRLSELGRLRRLDLSGNAVANLSALGDVSGLVWLRLPGNPVSDVAPLGRLGNLRWLWLDSGTAAGMEALAPPAGHGAAQLWIELTPAQ